MISQMDPSTKLKPVFLTLAIVKTIVHIESMYMIAKDLIVL